MGIRFHCPNGHKLNVKSFLAGKRGICPHCGAKFIIPTESPENRDFRVAEVTDAEGSQESDTASPVHGRPAEQSRTGRHGDGDQGAAAADTPQESVDLSQPAQTSTSHEAAESPHQTARVGREGVVENRDAVDAIAEAPNAIWYVRLPSGDQFGPAQSTTMSRWLAEGRVSSESLIWREDWPQWKLASSVFPQLVGTVRQVDDRKSAPPLAPSTEPLAEKGASPVVVDAERGSRRRKANRGVWLLVFLIIIVLFLAPVVGYVLWTSS